jgi:hypothetical protein
MAVRGAVEVLLDDARADADPQALRVDLADRGHVARGVEHDGAGAGRLARQAGARAARDDRDLEAPGEGDRHRDVAGVARERHEQRIPRVHARVAREQVAGVRVGLHLPAQLAPERRRELGPDVAAGPRL